MLLPVELEPCGYAACPVVASAERTWLRVGLQLTTGLKLATHMGAYNLFSSWLPLQTGDMPAMLGGDEREEGDQRGHEAMEEDEEQVRDVRVAGCGVFGWLGLGLE